MSGWAPHSAPQCHPDPGPPALALCLTGPFPSTASVIRLPSWLLAGMGPLPPLPSAPLQRFQPVSVLGPVGQSTEGDSPRTAFAATIACPGKHGAFLQPEAVASVGQGAQGQPWELPRRVAETCPCLSFSRVPCWGPVPSALTVPAQGSASLILQRGRAKPRGAKQCPRCRE